MSARVGIHSDTSNRDVQQGEQNIKVDISFLVGGWLRIARACVFDDERLVLVKAPWRIHSCDSNCLEAARCGKQKDG